MDEQAGRVIVGVDESLAALRALRVGLAEARRRGAELHAVRAWTVGPRYYGAGVAYLPPDEPKLAAEMVAEAFREAMGGPPVDVGLTVALPEGEPAGALVRYADRDDDLLVVGASRRRWGSTSGACARRARCPVLVVPPTEFARRVRRSVRRIRHEVAALERTGARAGLTTR
jgi:nucleotide-binding universal stress UspA family protein